MFGWEKEMRWRLVWAFFFITARKIEERRQLTATGRIHSEAGRRSINEKKTAEQCISHLGETDGEIICHCPREIDRAKKRNSNTNLAIKF